MFQTFVLCKLFVVSTTFTVDEMMGTNYSKIKGQKVEYFQISKIWLDSIF